MSEKWCLSDTIGLWNSIAWTRSIQARTQSNSEQQVEWTFSWNYKSKGQATQLFHCNCFSRSTLILVEKNRFSKYHFVNWLPSEHISQCGPWFFFNLIELNGSYWSNLSYYLRKYEENKNCIRRQMLSRIQVFQYIVLFSMRFLFSPRNNIMSPSWFRYKWNAIRMCSPSFWITVSAKFKVISLGHEIDESRCTWHFRRCTKRFQRNLLTSNFAKMLTSYKTSIWFTTRKRIHRKTSLIFNSELMYERKWWKK